MAAADWSGQILTGVSTLLEQAQMVSHKAPPSGGVRLTQSRLWVPSGMNGGEFTKTIFLSKECDKYKKILLNSGVQGMSNQ